MNRYFQYRIYPDEQQIELIKKTIGCSRKYYNMALADNLEYYKVNKKGKINTPAVYKKIEEYEYLKEVDSLALCNAQMNLKKAFTNFFRKKSKFPNFKSKKSNKQSYTTNNVNNSIRFEDGKLKLPKLGLLQGVWHRKCEGLIKSVTIKMNPNGKFFVSILVELSEKKKEVKAINKIKKVIGIDMSMSNFGVTSKGEKINPPKWIIRVAKRLGKYQRKFARQIIGSYRREKQKMKIANTYERLTNQRKDWLNKLSFKLAEQYDVVAVENINLRGMAINFGKSISQNSFGIFRQMMDYKMADKNKEFVKVPRFFPSTQLCNVCNYKNEDLKGLKGLKIKEWECPECHTFHDRDINAAINLENYYVNHINSTDASSGINAQGDCVRPLDIRLMATVKELGKIEGTIGSNVFDDDDDSIGFFKPLHLCEGC